MAATAPKVAPRRTGDRAQCRRQPQVAVGCQPPSGRLVDTGDTVTLEHVIEHLGKASPSATTTAKPTSNATPATSDSGHRSGNDHPRSCNFSRAQASARVTAATFRRRAHSMGPDPDFELPTQPLRPAGSATPGRRR
ncbi:hypothetical protein I552_5875 [Mycobacterium xenopi 3993]|nr:hypothetical protein I552_5875 [Mycobacterium xenopi 3993]